MISRVKMPPLRLVGHDACAFHASQHLIGRVDVRFGSGSVFEEDCEELKVLALFASDQVVHVNRTLEVFGVGWMGFTLVGL